MAWEDSRFGSHIRKMQWHVGHTDGYRFFNWINPIDQRERNVRFGRIGRLMPRGMLMKVLAMAAGGTYYLVSADCNGVARPGLRTCGQNSSQKIFGSGHAVHDTPHTTSTTFYACKTGLADK